MKQLIDLQYFIAVAKARSIRKAATKLSITSTALNRRILALEHEVGESLFERLPSGVRLSAAGEVFHHYAQSQLSGLERVKSQINDLKGIRRGHINIACSQALLTSFFPQQISKFRKRHPDVTFSLYLRDRKAAENALLDDSVDLALVYEPIYLDELQILVTNEQQLYALMRKNHPLASARSLKLSDCVEYPLALPTIEYGVRKILNFKAHRANIQLNPMVQSDSFEYLRNHVINENCITFQIEIGIPKVLDELYLIAIPMSKQDIVVGSLYLVQKKGRTLPIATARFAEQLIGELAE